MKKTTSITVDMELLDWLDEQIKKKRFASRSHAVELMIFHFKESDKN